MRTVRPRSITALTVAFTLYTQALAPPAYADLGSDMADFFNSAGGGMAVTPAQNYSGQTAHYLSGGGLSVRAPIRNFQMMQMSLPAIRAGCGGIDAYLGSFSFINTDSMINALKAIGTDSLGFAFLLALDIYSPDIAGVLKQMKSWADYFNKMSSNSCEAAQALVKGAMSLTDTRWNYCSKAAAASGTGNDYASARTICTDDAFTKQIASDDWNAVSKDANGMPVYGAAYDPARGGRDNLPFIGNVVWEGLRKDPAYGRSGALDLREMMMSLTGTIVFSKEGGPPAVYPATIGFQDFLKEDGATFEKYFCTTALGVDEDCFSPVPMPHSWPISFKGRITAGLHSLAARLAGAPTLAGTLLTADEEAVLKKSSLPVVRLFQVAEDIAPGSAALLVDEFAELITADLAYQYLREVTKVVRSAITASSAGDPEDKKALQDQLDFTVGEARQYMLQSSIKSGGMQAVIARIKFYDQTLASTISQSLQQRLAFARLLQAR